MDFDFFCHTKTNPSTSLHFCSAPLRLPRAMNVNISMNQYDYIYIYIEQLNVAVHTAYMHCCSGGD